MTGKHQHLKKKLKLFLIENSEHFLTKRWLIRSKHNEMKTFIQEIKIVVFFKKKQNAVLYICFMFIQGTMPGYLILGVWQVLEFFDTHCLRHQCTLGFFCHLVPNNLVFCLQTHALHVYVLCNSLYSVHELRLLMTVPCYCFY